MDQLTLAPGSLTATVDASAARLAQFPCDELREHEVILLANVDPWAVATGGTPPTELITAQLTRHAIPFFMAGTATRAGKTRRRNRPTVRLLATILSPRHLYMADVKVDLAPGTLVWTITNWDEINGQMPGQLTLPLKEEPTPMPTTDTGGTFGRDALNETYARHPLVAQVNAAFDAAGGTWAALQHRPLNRREVRREVEAIIRANLASPEALIREVCGYTDFLVNAAYDWGSAEAGQQPDAGIPA